MSTSDSNIRDQLNISIKKKWDYSPHINEEETDNGKKDVEEKYHIKRKENTLLVDFFSRREEGALLISGKRGVD